MASSGSILKWAGILTGVAAVVLSGVRRHLDRRDARLLRDREKEEARIEIINRSGRRVMKAISDLAGRLYHITNEEYLANMASREYNFRPRTKQTQATSIQKVHGHTLRTAQSFSSLKSSAGLRSFAETRTSHSTNWRLRKKRGGF